MTKTEYLRKWRDENRESIREYYRKYYAKNREKLISRSKAWYRKRIAEDPEYVKRCNDKYKGRYEQTRKRNLERRKLQKMYGEKKEKKNTPRPADQEVLKMFEECEKIIETLESNP